MSISTIYLTLHIFLPQPSFRCGSRERAPRRIPLNPLFLYIPFKFKSHPPKRFPDRHRRTKFNIPEPLFCTLGSLFAAAAGDNRARNVSTIYCHCLQRKPSQLSKFAGTYTPSTSLKLELLLSSESIKRNLNIEMIVRHLHPGEEVLGSIMISNLNQP